MIVVLDYGIGNVGSIVNMFKHIGVHSIISNKLGDIEAAEKLILPGVGAFDPGIKLLSDSGLIEAIYKHAIDMKKPLLGICLGMQMLGRRSEEGVLPGLGLISFENVKFKIDSSMYRIPHMGWNIVKMEHADPLLDSLEGVQRYYFAHSYHAVCDDSSNSLITCEYGYPFSAAVKKDNIYGVQFHPEKSHRFGMALLNNFARI